MDGTKIAHNFSRARTSLDKTKQIVCKKNIKVQFDLHRNINRLLTILPEGWFGEDVEMQPGCYTRVGLVRMTRATTRPRRTREGSQVRTMPHLSGRFHGHFNEKQLWNNCVKKRKIFPHQLTCFPWTSINAHRVTMFQLHKKKL